MEKEQISKYFERINLSFDPAHALPDEELLLRLQYAHVTHVPYENLDILNNIPLKLDEASLYNKIVLNSRGGYCFELNALYNILLTSLGYNTLSCFARYLRGETKIPMRRHRIIIAESDYTQARLFTDVGIGERAPRLPLRLEEDTVQEQFGEQYKFKKEPFLGWVLYDYHNGEWSKFLSFTEEPQLEEDYLSTSFYCEAAPESIFRESAMLSLKTDTGRITVSGDIFRIFDGDNVTQTTIQNKDAFDEILKKYYNITL